jgi:hypothetical protein
MLATGTIPLTPFLSVSGLVTLAGWIGIGLCAAVVAGFAIQRRDENASPTIRLADDDADAAESPRARLNG